MMMQEVLEDLNNELGEINDDIVPEEKEESTKNVFTGKDFKKLTKRLKNLVLNLLTIHLVKIINM